MCFTVLMMESQPSADNLCLFYGLLPSCSMWAINLSPAISKQCSNQWEIISANRWASLSLPLLLSYLYRFSQHPSLPHSPSPHPFCLVFCCLSVFSTHSFTPPLLLAFPSGSLSSAAPTLKCDSSAAREPLTKVAFTHGICNTAGLTFLASIMNLTCSYKQSRPSDSCDSKTHLLYSVSLLSSLVVCGQLHKTSLLLHGSPHDVFS